MLRVHILLCCSFFAFVANADNSVPVNLFGPVPTNTASHTPTTVSRPVATNAVGYIPAPASKSLAVNAVSHTPAAVSKPLAVNAVSHAPVAVSKPLAVNAVSHAPVAVSKPVAVNAVSHAPVAVSKPVVVNAVSHAPAEVSKPVAVNAVSHAPAAVSKPVVVNAVSHAPVAVSEPVVANADSSIWLLVDTKAHKIEVKKGEQTLETLQGIAIGRKGAGLKSHRGDDITPQGNYRIGWIGEKSHFRKFFGLTYPSTQDAEIALKRGIINEQDYYSIKVANQFNQVPPQNTPLGGQIGIHGIGDGDERVHQVFDWTHGCIALTNNQIDQLSQWLDTGTVVKIR